MQYSWTKERMHHGYKWKLNRDLDQQDINLKSLTMRKESSGILTRDMNIFYLHKDPVESAKLHCDKHVCKMIIEYAQMLSTAHRMLDGKEYISQTLGGRRFKRWKHPNSNMEGVLYKRHINHPSAKWVRENAIQYQFMYDMFVALCDEYTFVMVVYT